MSMGEERMAQVVDSFVSWAASQPDGAARRSDLDVVEAALAGREEGAVTQAADAALRLALVAACFDSEEMRWLAWALAALAETWMLQDGGA